MSTGWILASRLISSVRSFRRKACGGALRGATAITRVRRVENGEAFSTRFPGYSLVFVLSAAAVPPCWAGHFVSRACPAGTKVTKNACPTIRPCASLRVRSLHRRSRGTPRRAIPGPSRLSRHPCRSTPSTTIPLTLLKGALAFVRQCSRNKQKLTPRSFGDSDSVSVWRPGEANQTTRRARRNCCRAGESVAKMQGGVVWKTAQPFPRVLLPGIFAMPASRFVWSCT
jgi:hypothetical protein